MKEKGFLAAAACTTDRPAQSAQFITVKEYASELDGEYDDVFDFDVPLHLIANVQPENQACPR